MAEINGYNWIRGNIPHVVTWLVIFASLIGSHAVLRNDVSLNSEFRKIHQREYDNLSRKMSVFESQSLGGKINGQATAIDGLKLAVERLSANVENLARRVDELGRRMEKKGF